MELFEFYWNASMFLNDFKKGRNISVYNEGENYFEV